MEELIKKTHLIKVLQNKNLDLMSKIWISKLSFKYSALRRLKRMLSFIYSNYINNVPRQKELIYKRNYNMLIILDACRYDVFSHIIYDYLDGRLFPVRSPASTTIEWLKKTWSRELWSDTIYISANPFVNKRGIIKGFDAEKIFKDIVEVWDKGWNKEFLTVPPLNVNLSVKLTMLKFKLKGLKYGADYKLIVHYLQPHSPYILFKNVLSIISKSNLANDIIDINLHKSGRLHGLFFIDHIILILTKKYVGDNEKVRKLLLRAYETNLRWVLGYIANLVTEVNGCIVITADHGELLGEFGLYFHTDLPLPHLRIVPWFIVK